MFALGQAYQNNAELFSGERDFVLALSSLNLISPINGDFDGDGDVDGADFLAWQRDPTIGNLADWQAQFGTSGASTTGFAAVPEPSAVLLLLVGLASAGLGRRFPIL